MPQTSKSKTVKLSGLEGAYDVNIGSVDSGKRKRRWASKKAEPASADSQQYDDAKARIKSYGFDPDAPLPTQFFD